MPTDEDLSLLERVKDFCMSVEFESEFEDFGRRHWRLFADVDAEREQKLELYEVYTEYLETFEGVRPGRGRRYTCRRRRRRRRRR